MQLNSNELHLMMSTRTYSNKVNISTMLCSQILQLAIHSCNHWQSDFNHF